MESIPSLLWAFCKQSRRGLLLGALCVVLFWGVLALYLENVDAVLYASLLCGATVLLYGVFACMRFVRRCRAMERVQTHVDVSLEGLPQAETLLESQYEQLLRTLFHAHQMQNASSRRIRGELVDYYTMWVHQIKTPIAAMQLLLQSGCQDTRTLSTELFKIEQYVEMALSYARLEDLSTDLRLERVDVAAAARGAARKYAPLMILKKLRFSLEDFRATALSDEKWLVFLLEQLLSNAVKYTREGGRITIRLEEPLTIVIEDTGIGIDPSDLPRIFERGYTGYNGRQCEKSTGLGLYLCKRTCEKLGHQISIQSGRQGTTVRLHLERERRSVV